MNKHFFITALFLLTLCFTSCFNKIKTCQQNCENGYCDENGVCNCLDGYNGQWCNSGMGGGGSNCTNTCPYAYDGECDDGGPGSLTSLCPCATDCADCGSRTQADCGGGGGGSSSQIYYRWTEDLSFPFGSNASGCDNSAAPHYNNSHPDIPNGAIKNTYYGPVSPGSCTLDFSSAGGGSGTITLQAPAPGYKRYYTHMIKDYHEPLNRCLYVYNMSNALTYEDFPL